MEVDPFEPTTTTIGEKKTYNNTMDTHTHIHTQQQITTTTEEEN